MVSDEKVDFAEWTLAASTTEVTTSTTEITTSTSKTITSTSFEETTKTTDDGDKSKAFGLYSSNKEFTKNNLLVICFIMIKAMC